MLNQSASLAPDGAPYQLVILSNQAGMTVTIMDWGASWLSACVPLAGGILREALLSCPLNKWSQQTAYLGASVGRYANRIANSRFPLDGQWMHIQSNQGAHQLHGGPQGFDKRRWRIEQHSESAVLFGLTSPAGDQGFAGELEAHASFQLTADNCLKIEYQAQVSEPCPVNLTNHAYFNLDGVPTDVRQHTLQLLAHQWLDVNEQGIPGELQQVLCSGFDFRKPKKIIDDFLRDPAQRKVKGYDHGFLLDAQGDIGQPAARVYSSDNKLQLCVYTSAPALQFYTGNYLQGTPARTGGVYQDWQGMALESGFLADSPNHPAWPQPSCILRPGQDYRSITHYQFIAG